MFQKRFQGFDFPIIFVAAIVLLWMDLDSFWPLQGTILAEFILIFDLQCCASLSLEWDNQNCAVYNNKRHPVISKITSAVTRSVVMNGDTIKTAVIITTVNENTAAVFAVHE